MNKPTIVFDIDDTICDNNYRDYENAIPFTNVIRKINVLYDAGYTVKLLTARGMKSCNYDGKKADAKNRPTLEKWLEEKGVKYHELQFGKPLADLYIDDKCMDVQEFLIADFKELNGGSNQPLYQMGKYVKKYFKTEDEVKSLKCWQFIASRLGINTPKIISSCYNSAVIEFVPGRPLSKDFNLDDFYKIVNTILIFKECQGPLYIAKNGYNSAKLRHHGEKLVERIKKVEYWSDFEEEELEVLKELEPYYFRCLCILDDYSEKILHESSFSHGDYTLSNMIKNDDGIHLIDIRYDSNNTSYLYDFAKLRMSISGWCYRDELLTIYLDEILKSLGIYEVVIVLNLMYILRLYRYQKDDINGLKKMLKMVKELEVKNARLFRSK